MWLILCASSLAATLQSADLADMGVSPELRQLHAQVAQSRLTGNEQVDALLLRDGIPSTLARLQAEANSSDATPCSEVVMADAGLHFATLGLSVNPPLDLAEQEHDAFLHILREYVFPEFVELRTQMRNNLDLLTEDGTCTEYAQLVRANVEVGLAPAKRQRRKD